MSSARSSGDISYLGGFRLPRETVNVNDGNGWYVYKWLVHNDVNWNAVTGWTSSNMFAWTPTAANPNYRVTVWVKRASNTEDAPEVSAPGVIFPIQ